MASVPRPVSAPLAPRFASLRPLAVMPLLLLVLMAAGWPPAALADAQPRMVTAADYRIGVEGLPTPTPAARMAAVTAAEPGPTLNRELASLYGGEHGASIPARGYLSDVVWSEQALSPASAAATATRILYYSFNIGPWQQRLDSETTVLTRAFMTHPLLVFLQDTDKERIAGLMVSSSLFAQAVTEHRRYVLDPLWINSALLDDLVEGLGEYGISQLTDAQKAGGTQALASRLAARAATAASPAAATGIDFFHTERSFAVFRGMSVAGSRTTAQSEQLDFTSYSTWTYGVQEVANFENVQSGLPGFLKNLDRHLLQVPLLTPVTGWLDKDLVKKTTLDLSSIPPLGKVAGSAQVVIFRNNPYLTFDAPMVMNLVTAAAVTAEIVGTGAALFNPALIPKMTEGTKKFISNAKYYLEFIPLVVSVAEAAQQLLCSSDSKEVLCGEYLSKVSKTLELAKTVMATFNTSFKSVADAAKAGEAKKPFDQDTFCGAAVLQGRFIGNVRKTPLDKNENRTQLAVCAFNEMVTKPLVSSIEHDRPTTYNKIKDVAPIKLTADFFRRAGWKINVEGVPADIRLESLVAQLISKNNIKGWLTGVSGVLDVGNDVLEFCQSVKEGKVRMGPLFAQLQDALLDYLYDNGNEVVATMLLDVFKALTPAKFVQLADAFGNKGTALAWDYITDPALVKLQMTRSTKDTLDIALPIPEMVAVRYLTVPLFNPKIISHTLTGSQVRARDNSLLYPLALDGGSNNLLVLPGFIASVENQSAFRTVDKGTIQQLLKDGSVELVWNVKKFKSSAEAIDVPLSARNNQDFNYLKTTVKDSIFPWWDSIVGIDEDDTINQRIFGTSIGDYEAVDFTEIYRQQLGDKQPYPLIHKTSGIYSDYTHLDFTSVISGNPKRRERRKLFSSTFSVYVLNDLDIWDTRLVGTSALYRERKAGQLTGAGEVQLNFSSAGWDKVGTNGLWAVWRTMENGSLVWSEPVALGSIRGGETRVLAFPAGLDVDAAYVLIFDDIVNGYFARTKVSRAVVFDEFDRIRAQRQYPVIRLALTSLPETQVALLPPKDTDGDGVPDTLDAFKSDPKWAYDTDKDGMPDEWETRYGLNLYDPKDAGQDKDGDKVSNLAEFKANTNPARETPKPTATPGSGKVTLTWSKPAWAVAQGVCVAPQAITDPYNCFTAAQNSLWLPDQSSPAVVPDLTNGKTYYFIVQAEAANGDLSNSAQITATPIGPVITSIGPLTGTAGQTVSISVAGGNLPSTIVANIAAQLTGCTTSSAAAKTATFRCPLSIAGSHALGIKTKTAANGGVVIGGGSATFKVLPKPGATGRLNDTGITACSNEGQNGLPCPLATHPGQDGDSGRDATANDDRDGHAGFSFTKLDANGKPL